MADASGGRSVYAGPWRDGIRERYGIDPQIKFFQTACITDKLAPDTADGQEQERTWPVRPIRG